MPDEWMKLLTLDRWGAANLDKWWKTMGMNSSSGEETEEKMEMSRAGKMEMGLCWDDDKKRWKL